MSKHGLTLAVAAAMLCAPLQAQDLSRGCPKATEVTHEHLLGMWRAEFEGQPLGATLLLEPHPELKESVRGAINRNGERADVSGDVDDGEFTLEESENGINISATWVGDVVEGSCGREIRGYWELGANKLRRNFVLRKL